MSRHWKTIEKIVDAELRLLEEASMKRGLAPDELRTLTALSGIVKVLPVEAQTVNGAEAEVSSLSTEELLAMVKK